jgi:hypothetical protein
LSRSINCSRVTVGSLIVSLRSSVVVKRFTRSAVDSAAET